MKFTATAKTPKILKTRTLSMPNNTEVKDRKTKLILLIHLKTEKIFHIIEKDSKKNHKKKWGTITP